MIAPAQIGGPIDGKLVSTLNTKYQGLSGYVGMAINEECTRMVLTSSAQVVMFSLPDGAPIGRLGGIEEGSSEYSLKDSRKASVATPVCAV